jgi:hypothetical protein
VALTNLDCFFVELAIDRLIASGSFFADSVDFLEATNDVAASWLHSLPVRRWTTPYLPVANAR